MKKFLFLLFSFVLLHFVSSVSFACSCAPPRIGETEIERIKVAHQKAKAIFSGKVLKVKVRKSSDTNPFPSVQVTFKVLETWKGVETEKVIIATEDNRYGGCGSEFKVGKTYLVYAYTSESGGLETNQCTRTNELPEEERDLKVLGKGNGPTKAKT